MQDYCGQGVAHSHQKVPPSAAATTEATHSSRKPAPYHIKGALDKITIEQLATALVVRDFDEELSKEWARHLGSLDKIPDMKQLLDFIRPLSHNLPAKTKPASNHHHATKTTIKKEDTSSNSSFKNAAAFSGSSTNNSKNCALCKGSNHSLARYQVFLDSDINQRWSLIKQHKYCANCLHQSHQVNSCASSFTCRECKARHNTLLHRGDDISGGKGDKQTAKMLMTSVKVQLLLLRRRILSRISRVPQSGQLSATFTMVAGTSLTGQQLTSVAPTRSSQRELLHTSTSAVSKSVST